MGNCAVKRSKVETEEEKSNGEAVGGGKATEAKGGERGKDREGGDRGRDGDRGERGRGGEGDERGRDREGDEGLNENMIMPVEAPTITGRDKEVIKVTWPLLEGCLSKLGVIMYISFFERHPESREYFDTFQRFTEEELHYSTQLSAHAVRVMGVVQKVTARIDHLDKVATLVQELGVRHQTTHHAKANYFILLGYQFIKAIQPTLEEEKLWSEEVERAWTNLFHFIDYHMKVGVKRAIEESRRGMEEERGGVEESRRDQLEERGGVEDSKCAKVEEGRGDKHEQFAKSNGMHETGNLKETIQNSKTCESGNIDKERKSETRETDQNGDITHVNKTDGNRNR